MPLYHFVSDAQLVAALPDLRPYSTNLWCWQANIWLRQIMTFINIDRFYLRSCMANLHAVTNIPIQSRKIWIWIIDRFGCGDFPHLCQIGLGQVRFLALQCQLRANQLSAAAAAAGDVMRLEPTSPATALLNYGYQLRPSIKLQLLKSILNFVFNRRDFSLIPDLKLHWFLQIGKHQMGKCYFYLGGGGGVILRRSRDWSRLVHVNNQQLFHALRSSVARYCLYMQEEDQLRWNLGSRWVHSRQSHRVRWPDEPDPMTQSIETYSLNMIHAPLIDFVSCRRVE